MDDDRTKILLTEPAASSWADGFPLGSGRIGAMVWGAPGSEIISFNHDLLWRAAYEGPAIRAGEKAERIRGLCLAGRWGEAEDILRSLLPEQRGVYINPFVPFCDLFLNLYPPDGDVTDYVRELDMERGCVRVSFSRGGTRYGFTCFCSYRYNAFFLKLTSSRPAALSGDISLFRMPDAECSLSARAHYRELFFDGCFDEGKRFSAAVRIRNRGGRTLIGKREASVIPEKSVRTASLGLSYSFDRDTGTDPDRGPSLIFDSCGELIVTAALAVDNESDDPAAFARKTLDVLPDFETALAEHADDFASLFGRTRLFLGPSQEEAQLERAYNLSRYLAISAGRPQPPGRVPKAPMNLQGIWCRDTRPAWESDYHTDLNIQMCYWPMAQAGLPEWYEPLLQWTERLLPQAEERARDLYGKRGAVWNGCCDPWILGGTDNVGYGFLGAGAWIMQTLFTAWEYAPSAELARRLLGPMLPTARFLDDMLVTREDGTRTFPFGSSPEMGILTDGRVQWLASASVCDLLLTKELFAAVDRLQAEAGIPEDEREIFDALSVRDVLRDGRIGEWTEEHEECEPGHRHRSPFVCFCPGHSVTAEKEPGITAALSDLLDRRLGCGGAMSTSFSYVWDAQILARLRRSGEAYGRLRELFRIHLLPNGMLTTNDWSGRGGIGWFSDTKVLQLDASLGLISAVTELFCQDQNGAIELFVPAQIPAGRMTGLRCRSGFVTDFAWEDGQVRSLTVRSLRGGPCSLRIPGCVGIFTGGAAVSGDGEFVFPTEAGGVYEIVPLRAE